MGGGMETFADSALALRFVVTGEPKPSRLSV